jgi:hypothetical protein
MQNAKMRSELQAGAKTNYIHAEKPPAIQYAILHHVYGSKTVLSQNIICLLISSPNLTNVQGYKKANAKYTTIKYTAIKYIK